jgi:hypothetical protein
VEEYVSRIVFMVSRILQEIANKSMTRLDLLRRVEKDFSLLQVVIDGISSPKASIRYSCASVLTELSKTHPDKLYLYVDFFITLLDSKYRIFTWNAMSIIANLARVDKDRKFDAIFTKYYGFLNDEYMVTVANVVSNSSKIALAKPYLTQRIADELLKVGNISVTPHLTEECKRVIAEKTIESFDILFDHVENREKIVEFVKNQLNSPRKTLKTKAENFLKKWNCQTRDDF